jgi:hypothetical protein
MKSKNKITNSKSNIFARIRGNHYGESQSFTTIDEALTWVQHTSRELVESGYANVTFTIQGEYHYNDYQGHVNDSQYCDSIQSDRPTPESKIDSITNKNEDMKKIIKSTTDFFSLSETEIGKIATATMEAAISSKELSDSEFESAIADASNGMVTLRRSTKTPERVNFLCWDAYTATHSPHNPGHKPLEAIEQAIIDTYRRGQSRTSVSIESGANMSNTCINNGLTSGCHNNTTVDELIKNIICTIHVHLLQDENVRTYLCCNSAGVDAEISAMTGGTISCSVSETKVTLSCGSGVTCSLPIEGKTMNDIERDIRTILIRYLLHASISPRSRDAIACIIDLESLADMALIEDLIADSDAPLYSNSLL